MLSPRQSKIQLKSRTEDFLTKKFLNPLKRNYTYLIVHLGRENSIEVIKQLNEIRELQLSNTTF